MERCPQEVIVIQLNPFFVALSAGWRRKERRCRCLKPVKIFQDL